MTWYNGILLVDKPRGVSSAKVVGILRHIIRQKKIGHTGTLDPEATGLLVMCLGRATKIARFLTGLDKTYEARIELGVRSVTYDTEGIDESSRIDPPPLSDDDLRGILDEFEGLRTQQVPAYSAVKVDGQRLYKMVRRGEKVTPPERLVDIKCIRLMQYDAPFLHLTVTCSKGTYIRSLANDIGERIGCGACLTGLNRTRVGDFEVAAALAVNDIEACFQSGRLEQYIHPIENVLRLPAIEVARAFAPAVIAGKKLRLEDIADIRGEFEIDECISLVDHRGKIMAIGKADINSARLRRRDTEDIDGAGLFTYLRVLN